MGSDARPRAWGANTDVFGKTGNLADYGELRLGALGIQAVVGTSFATSVPLCAPVSSQSY